MKTRSPVLNAVALALGLTITSASQGAALFDPAQQPYGDIPRLAVTGFNLTLGTQRTFQVWFDGYNSVGDVVAYPLDTAGRTDSTLKLWSARDVYKSQQACGNSSPSDPGTAVTTWYDTGRKVVFRNATGTNKAFRWANLTAAQQASIGDATNGPKILNFVRGDRSNEKLVVDMDGTGLIVQYQCGVSTGIFHARRSILGDIEHARPMYVGAPRASYQFDSYSTFKSTNAARAGRVYVGANDGMVHALDAATGAEVWSYVPSMVIPNLNKLATDPYNHTPFVDGTMSAGDVNFGSTAAPDWRTVLVGGLGGGGKGLFALNVTSPDASSELVASSKILWEITPASTGFAELGHTYGDPIIVRISTGQWAAIVGNGYNNTGNGHAVLYVIDITNGTLIKAIDTGSGTAGTPNGLSSPTAIDTDGDGKVDRVYAGDIDGNLWKFDLSSTTPSSWPVPTAPLQTTGGKAIIGAPDAAFHPVNGLLVFFATGRLLNSTDACDSTVQNYAYGIWDGAPAANAAILDQTLTPTDYQTDVVLKVRVSSGNAINWTDASDPTNKPLHRGWRTALPVGERVVGAGFVSDGRYQFTSINPTKVNNPPPNGENWLNELDYLTGGVGSKLIFDLSGNGALGDEDRIQSGTGAIAGAAGIPVSVFQGKGLMSQPVLVILSAQLSSTIFNANPFFGPVSNSSCGTTGTYDPGVSGGHFDVDIYNAAGKLLHHHEYDDTYDVTGVNFLNASDPGFNISNVIPSTATKFKILVAHQKMSPAVSFSSGGSAYKGVTKLDPYVSAGLTMASLPAYDRTTIKTLKYNMPKDAFQVKDWSENSVSPDPRVGLMPTKTGCVNGSATGDIGPAPNLLNHNGALMFQVVKDTTPDSAIQLADAAGDPKYGYRIKNGASRTSYLLGEWTTFWHHPNGKCFGDAGWVPNPPQDTTATTSAPSAPVAGSSDPPYDVLGTRLSSTVSTVATTGGGSIRTTVTVYSSGAQIIVVETLDKKGKVLSVTVTSVPPPDVGAPCTVNCGSTYEVPPTLTGFQQSRFSGKAGRVTWHEVFTP
jgi:hypothetical protein